jgi:transposase
MNTDTVTVKRKGRPSKGESIKIRKQIIDLGKNTKNLPMREIAGQVGVSINTVSDVLAKYGINKVELDSFVENRNSIVKSKQKIVLDALTTDKANKASFKDLAIAYGVLLDKDRLESGESTANIHQWTAIVQASNRKEVDITPNNV